MNLHVTWCVFLEIMGKDFDYKKLRMEVGKRRDLAASFQNSKKKKERPNTFVFGGTNTLESNSYQHGP